MPRASNHLLLPRKAGVEKLREKEGRGSAPFPAPAGAARCLPGSPGEKRGAGSAAPPAAESRLPQRSLPSPGRGFLRRSGAGISREGGRGCSPRCPFLPPPQLLSPRRASAARAQAPRLLGRRGRCRRRSRACSSRRRCRRLPQRTNSFSTSRERRRKGSVPGGSHRYRAAVGVGPRSGKKSLLSSGKRRIISCQDDKLLPRSP